MFYRFRYFRRARALALSPAEKEASRRALLTFMETHPVRAGVETRPLEQRSNPLFSFFAPVLKPIPLALVTLLLIGGGTASAAERSLPDSPLYFLKLNVTEPVRRTLAISPEAKAEVEADLAARRLEEAEKLAATNRLTGEAQAKVEARFKEQADRAEAKIVLLKESGDVEAAADLSARYETKLRTRQYALDRLSEQAADAKVEIAPAIDGLRLKTAAAIRQRLDLNAEASTTVQAPSERRTSEKWKKVALEVQARIDVQLTEIQDAVAKADLSTKSDWFLKVQTSFADAQDLTAKAQASFQVGAYADAAALYERAQDRLREANSRLRAARKADADPKPKILIPSDKDPKKDDESKQDERRKDDRLLKPPFESEKKREIRPIIPPPDQIFFQEKDKIEADRSQSDDEKAKADLDQKTP